VEWFESIKVLYVEDEESIRESLSRFLRRRIRHLITAENGQKGLELFKAERPDIVITDIQMPLMTGLEMAEAIKAIDEETPIVITTAFNDEEYFVRSIDIGIEKYIKKPIDNRQLLATLERLAQFIHSQRELEAKNSLIQAILDVNPGLFMITEGKKPYYFNHSFLEFMGIDSIESFNRDKHCLNELLFSASEEEFHDRIEREIGNEKGSIIQLKRPDEESETPESYLMTVSKIPKFDFYLVSLSNVTVLESERQKYHDLAIKDPLTGIYNRMYWMDEFDKEISRSKRYDHPLSVVMFDIDHFKSVNDTFGHQVGDQVLIKLVDIISESIRDRIDLFARYGGEEFILMLPESHLDGAKEMAEKLRQRIEEACFPNVEHITCSFGVSALRVEDCKDVLIKRADDALYRAKEEGRNRVSAN